MAFPTIAGTAISVEAANTTTHDVTMPASVAAGDLLLAWVFQDGNATGFTWDTAGGWNELVDAAIGANVAWVTVGYKIAAGGETTTAVTSTGSERSSHIAARITGWHGTEPPYSNGAATGTSANPDPASANPTNWDIEDTLWIAWHGCDAQNTTAFPLADNNVSTGTGDVASAAYGAICSATSAVASLDPGTFTIGASDEWRAGVIAVRPAAGVLFIPSRSAYPQLLAH